MNVAKYILEKREDRCRNGLRNMTEIYGLHELRPQLSQHANETGHYPLWEKVKFIDHDPHTGTPYGLRRPFT